MAEFGEEQLSAVRNVFARASLSEYAGEPLDALMRVAAASTNAEPGGDVGGSISMAGRIPRMILGSGSQHLSSLEVGGSSPSHASWAEQLQKDTAISNEVLRMIVQYLQDEGYTAAAMTLQDEAQVKSKALGAQRLQLRRIKKAILDGDWGEVEKICSKAAFRNLKSFQYAVCRQQFLELIDAQEHQKAFALLNKRLKPLEAYSLRSGEFAELCYLLTCKSVADVPSFSEWSGVARGREMLVSQFATMLEFEVSDPTNPMELPAHRLVTLLQQAVAYQVAHARYHPRIMPRITTLLQDFHCFVVPNAPRAVFAGHKSNVKSVTFVGHAGDLLATGSSDATIMLWDIRTVGTTKSPLGVLTGHTARVWDIASTRNGSMLLSGSGDGKIALWSIGFRGDRWFPAGHGNDESFGSSGRPSSTSGVGSDVAARNSTHGSVFPSKGSEYVSSSVAGRSGDADANHYVDTGTAYEKDAQAGSGSTYSWSQLRTFEGHSGDVYSVNFHPREKHLVSAGYDRAVRLYDIETGTAVKSFHGHFSSVSRAIFNPHGNLIITGSKDCTIRFWDILSGTCIKTISSHLGEVTSIESNASGSMLLSSSKDNSNRLWDLRMQKPVRRFKGHQNTSKNFIRTTFGPDEQLIFGGSEDSKVYAWDRETGYVVQRLSHAGGPVYFTQWNANQSLLASCGHDGTARTWFYDAAAAATQGQPEQRTGGLSEPAESILRSC
ncbi:putative WD repeat-containing protein [Porphyridium purpureum]|uniref:WD40 repeat-containing protein SMU1 n=1 Tax=Porphyridium purpureum TaxID=35688 RepID=A0A5J4YQB2_PORPP|nr:putative WD repeat-containing protein [Porphyridium purpureum]|eukprot:POR4936..scf236_6